MRNTILCEQCNTNAVNKQNGSKRFCSVLCFAASLKGKGNPAFKDGRTLDIQKYHQQRRRANPEKSRLATRKWHSKNKAKANELCKSWRKRNPKYAHEWIKNRMATDIQFQLRYRLRNRLSIALQKKTKKGSAVTLLGCTIDQLRHHLEIQFKPGMTWKNYGTRTGWQIDHEMPVSAFDLTNPDQLAAACHHTNLQPLWAHENYAKSDSI